jgi:hypothetical protein
VKTLAAIFIIIGMIFLNVPLRAEEDGVATFYSNFIEQKIDNCIDKALLIDSSSGNIRTCASESIRQASFYKHNKEILIKQMIEQDFGESKSKANYFLIKVYFDSLPTRLAAQ